MKKLVFLTSLGVSLVLKLQGQQLSAADFSQWSHHSKVTVIVFLAVDCPISQKYLGELNKIADRHTAAQLFMTGIIPGEIKKKDLAVFINEYQIHFLTDKDKGNYWVQKLKPQVTPEVFVFDDHGLMRYQGAIDNWFYELGGHRQEATEHYLNDAIESLLQGVEPDKKKTEAIGCIIQMPAGK